MSEISKILQKLENTSEYEILSGIEKAYKRIEAEQEVWYKETNFFCPSGCGSCCINFEPDLIEGEALYFAAWLLENQEENALKILEGKYPFENGKTCPFYNPENDYHCSVYGGRPFICRLFGASSFLGKDGRKIWRPCKFYPDEFLEKYKTGLCHKDYSEEEAEKILGKIPPVMSDLMEESISCGRNTNSLLIRECLPQAVKRLLWKIQLKN